MKRIITLLFFSAVILFAANSFAQLSRNISYQGALLDDSNNPVDGTRSLTLRLYDVQGAVVYEETHQNVQVRKGIFNVIIGSMGVGGSIPQTVQFNQQLFLGVAINGGPELVPRTPLTSAPYALFAYVADELAPNAKGVVTTLNTKSGAIRLVGGGGTTINAGGDSILISSSGSGGTGIQGIQSTDGTIGIANPNGPVANLSISSQSATNGQVLMWNGTKWAPASPSPNVSVVSPITGNGASFNPLTINAANEANNGYLSAADWTTFNNKMTTVAVTARLTGNGTAANPLNIAQQGATNGQVLTWNGTSWVPASAGLTLPYSANGNNAADLFSLTNTGAGAAITGTTTGNGTGVVGSTNAMGAGVEAQFTGPGIGTALKVTGGYMKVAGATRTAIQHTTAANNINQNMTLLNYPGMAATDMLFVTHKFGQANLPGGQGVMWNGNAWLIYNENAALNMPIGEVFNVLIIKQ